MLKVADIAQIGSAREPERVLFLFINKFEGVGAHSGDDRPQTSHLQFCDEIPPVELNFMQISPVKVLEPQKFVYGSARAQALNGLNSKAGLTSCSVLLNFFSKFPQFSLTNRK